MHTFRFREAFSWLLAFCPRQRGTLTRRIAPSRDHVTEITFTCDASPWGIGGVLYSNGDPISWFADRITQMDTQLLRANSGESKHLTIWEALAILVGLRLWRSPDHTGASVQVRSDSLGALLSASKGSSSSPGLNHILREIALEDAELGNRISAGTHIPGMTNKAADALSRLWAPAPAAIPAEPQGVPHVKAPAPADRCAFARA